MSGKRKKYEGWQTPGRWHLACGSSEWEPGIDARGIKEGVA